MVPAWASERFSREGFIFVYQDVRGRMMSEGDFVYMTPYLPVKRGKRDVDESTDTYDTIEWLIRNVPNHNGRVGVWGISFPGFYAAAVCSTRTRRSGGFSAGAHSGLVCGG